MVRARGGAVLVPGHLRGMGPLRLHCHRSRKGDHPVMFRRYNAARRGGALHQAQGGPPAAAYPRAVPYAVSGLGSRRPTQLLPEMMELCWDDEKATCLFAFLFMQRLTCLDVRSAGSGQ